MATARIDMAKAEEAKKKMHEEKERLQNPAIQEDPRTRVGQYQSCTGECTRGKIVALEVANTELENTNANISS